jgi:membrane-associated phospholipid phosphatase
MASLELPRTKSASTAAHATDWSDRRFAGWLIAACLGVLLVMLIADRSLALAAAHLPASVTEQVSAVTDDLKGKYFIILAFAATLIALAGFLGGPESASGTLRETAVNAAFVCSTIVVALIAASLLKFIIGRARPELIGLYGPFAFSPFSTAKAMMSFPSGETAMTTAFFGACAWLSRERIGAFFAMLIFAPAILIAASRVVVGAHYPSDVLAAIVVAVAVIGWLYHALHLRRDAVAGMLDHWRAKVRTSANPS